MRNVLLSCLLSLGALQGAAAQEAVVDPAIDPPGRVARVSYTDGDVSMAPAGTEEWAEAVLNRPLTSGDRLWVDSGARAELQVGSASIHLDQGTGFSFVDLDDERLQMKLTDGAATIRVQRKLDNERIEIDTPNATVSLLHPGEYHIEVTATGETVVKTRSGESEVQGEGNSYTVRANEQAVFKGTAELTADINPLGPRTAFEDWANDRDRRDEGSVSAQYVSPEVIGYEDLDRDGEWISEASYGYVWRPRYVVAGWAPYRFGRWAWVSPWGWSWIDDARWGFATSHYGRWAYLRSRWCWVPGPRHIRPVYAPALVAWTGSPGFSASVSFGSGIGWFPLGPREVYVPGYRYSRRYIHNVNASNTIIVHNTDITNIYNGRGGRFNYRYGHDTHAVTVVARDRFVGGRPIGGHSSHTDEGDLRRWHRDARPPAIAPDRDSVLAARAVTPRSFNRASGEHTRFADSGISRIPFAAERQAIAANGGRPVSRSQLTLANPQPGNSLRNELRADRERSGDAGVSPVRQDRPDNVSRSEEPTRSLGDRPTWARQRSDDSPRSDSARVQREARPVAMPDRARDRIREDGNRWPSPRSAAGEMPATALRSEGGINAPTGSTPSVRVPSTRESRPQWRGDNTPQRVQREERRALPDVTALRERSNQQEGRARERSPERTWQQLPVQPQSAQPRSSAPREQPRPVQPSQTQPSVERPRVQRAPEGSIERSRQQGNEPRSGQSRSFNRPSPRQ